MNSRPVPIFLFALLVTAVSAATASSCTARDVPIASPVVSTLAPLSAPVASVTLLESAGMFIGEPAGVLVTDGFLYVADSKSASVLQFTREGRLVRRIGRRGRGPGELLAPTAIAAMGDTAIAVADAGSAQVVVFGTDSGRYRLARRTAGAPFSLSVAGDTLLTGSYDAMQRHTMHRTMIGDSGGRSIGPISADYATSRRLKYAYPYSVAAFAPGGAVTGLVGSRMLYRTDANGLAVDSVLTESRVRRGVPPDIEEQLAKPRAEGAEMLLVSILLALATHDERSALVHMDFTPQGPSVGGRAFLSVIDWSSRRQCVDAEIPIGRESRAVFSFRGDTLVVAQQLVEDNALGETGSAKGGPEVRGSAPGDPASAAKVAKTANAPVGSARMMVQLFVVPACNAK